MGASFSGRTRVSKTRYVGSIPTAPAITIPLVIAGGIVIVGSKMESNGQRETRR